MRTFAGPTRASATKIAPPVRRQLRHPLPAQRAVLQRRAGPGRPSRTSEASARGGLPDRLRAGVEALSGRSMADVRVHRDSAEPAKLGALAFTRGSDIHLGPGQEQHLPHEAWHAVQQKEGRVYATTQMKGIAVNASASLEREADTFAASAGRMEPPAATTPPVSRADGIATSSVSQLRRDGDEGLDPQEMRELVRARGLLRDSQFAAMLRDDDLRYQVALAPYGYRGSFVADADFLHSFDRAAAVWAVREGGAQSAGEERGNPALAGLAARGNSRTLGNAGGPTGAPSGAAGAPPAVSSVTVGRYRDVGGDHVHQVGARKASTTTKRERVPQYWDALSVDTNSPGYDDRAGQRIEAAINRGAHGRDYSLVSTDPTRVSLQATGNTDLGRTRVAVPSYSFENTKSLFKLIEARVPPMEALALVNNSATHLAAAGARPKRVPNTPARATAAAKAGQDLSPEMPASRVLRALPQSRPMQVFGAMRSGAGKLGAMGDAGQIFSDLMNGRPGKALEGAAVTAGVTWAVKTVPWTGPIFFAFGWISGYDETAKQQAQSAGEAMEDWSGSETLGAFTAGGAAVLSSGYRGVVKPTIEGIAAGALAFAPSRISFPDLGPDQAIFGSRITQNNRSGCQICHDAVRVCNWANQQKALLGTLDSAACRGGIPTDLTVKYFESNVFPLNTRTP